MYQINHYFSLSTYLWYYIYNKERLDFPFRTFTTHPNASIRIKLLFVKHIIHLGICLYCRHSRTYCKLQAYWLHATLHRLPLRNVVNIWENINSPANNNHRAGRYTVIYITFIIPIQAEFIRGKLIWRASLVIRPHLRSFWITS